jgi:hypothetical protein
MRLLPAQALERGSDGHPWLGVGAWVLVLMKPGRRIAGLLGSLRAEGQHPADSRYAREESLALLHSKWPWFG